MDAVQALKQILLFKHVSEPVLKLVAEVAEEVTFAPGETIADERQTPGALLLIRSGTVRASVEGKPPVTFGTGEAIGQMSLIDDGPAGMTAVALERVEAFAIRRQKLADKLAGNYEAGFQLYRAVARSLAARLRRVLDEVALASERVSRD
jgi:CRP/FNR family transcriptional regulator, cyclic AMP receptor protein